MFCVALLEQATMHLRRWFLFTYIGLDVNFAPSEMIPDANEFFLDITTFFPLLDDST